MKLKHKVEEMERGKRKGEKGEKGNQVIFFRKGPFLIHYQNKDKDKNIPKGVPSQPMGAFFCCNAKFK